MDDTAFFYSRTLRIIIILAIVLPILGIAGLLWHFSSDDTPEPPASEAEATADEIGQNVELQENDGLEEDDNPLKPVGPKASTRVIPGGTVCPVGGGSCESCG